jgi:hypothetical protein
MEAKRRFPIDHQLGDVKAREFDQMRSKITRLSDSGVKLDSIAIVIGCNWAGLGHGVLP